MNLNTYSVKVIPLADLVGSRRPRRFFGPNKCSFCETVLSSYNGLEICGSCLKKVQAKFVKDTGTPASPKIAYSTRPFPKLPRRKELPCSQHALA